MVMKNIHILPTDKPSRLVQIKNNLFFTTTTEIPGGFFNHIYITSDEKIKEGDWFIHKTNADCSLHKCIDRPSKQNVIGDDNIDYFLGFCKKIILTTDQDLIKDGVQDIDDEFLEWFAKNSDCEEVETFIDIMGCSLENCNGNPCVNYKIIISKEKQKQYIIDIMKADEELGLYEEPKQIKCYCGHTTYCDCSPQEEPKQETLEETAERLFPKEKHPTSFETLRKAFISSAGRQQRQQEKLEKLKDLSYWRANAEEDYMKVPISVLRYITELENRMYSEEEVIDLLQEMNDWPTIFDGRIDIKEWFEQFKKK
jgi:hypothetical protein